MRTTGKIAQKKEFTMSSWQDPAEGDYLPDGSDDQGFDVWLQCNKCGGEAYRKGDDALDYCNECGIVEGNTKEVKYENQQ